MGAADESETPSSRTDLGGEASREQAPTAAKHEAKPSALHRVGTWLGWIAAILGVILCGSSIWVLNTFGQISFQQMIANIPGLGGEGGRRGSCVLYDRSSLRQSPSRWRS